MAESALKEPIRSSSPDRSRLASKGVDEEATSVGPLAALDRVLDLLGRRELSTTELRVLLRLLDARAGLAELAPELAQPPIDVRSAARSLAGRGLVRWLHGGDRKQTQLEITPIGLAMAATFLGAAVQALDDTDPAEASAPPREPTRKSRAAGRQAARCRPRPGAAARDRVSAPLPQR